MTGLAHGPRTIAERIVTELERCGVVRFGAAFEEARALIADILIEEINRPSMRELVEQARKARRG